MKTQNFRFLLASGLAVGMLSSCAAPAPHGSYGQTSVTTSSYEPGYRINTLPSGYRREVISGNDFYYHDGAYYRPESSGYVVVEAPRSSRYYSDYDRHRSSAGFPAPNIQRDQRDDRVTVITRLPDGYRTVNHGGSRYYQSGDSYYRRHESGYMVVNRPY